MPVPAPFWRGAIAGAAFGALLAAAASPMAQRLVGRDGPLSGWSVVIDGAEACSDPWVFQGSRTIECD